MDNSEKKPIPKIMESVLDSVGKTPLIKLNYVAKHLECDVYAKCEYFNPGGSVKDRVAKRMILEKLKSGEIKQDTTIIEPSSGNTGIGVAMIGAALGLKVTITIAEKNSREKMCILKALGARVVETPTTAAYDSPDSNIEVAKRLNKEIENSIILDQYNNPMNPLAHYEETAEEILEQCGGKVDMFVAGIGTGGTITGIAKRLKEQNPDCIVVGADPEGSLLSIDAAPIGPYEIEGIGYEFLPKVYDRKNIDYWVKTNDEDSFLTARKLVQKEGLLVGGSSGAAVQAALVSARVLKKGQRCVVMLPDSSRNYLTKFLDDGWMTRKGFLDFNVADIKVKNPEERRVSEISIKNNISISRDTFCGEAYNIVIEKGVQFAAVVDDSHNVIGVISMKKLRNNIEKGNFAGSLVEEHCEKDIDEVLMTDSVKKLAEIFEKKNFVVVYTLGITCSKGEEKEVKQFAGIIEKWRILDLVSNE